MVEPRAKLGSSGENGARRSLWWGVNASRYLHASHCVYGKNVLDIACGTGYGMTILRRAGASRVVGVDLDWDTLRDAGEETGGLTVALANGHHLPFRAETFDVVTSFETIEHLYDRNRFLSELRRVLKSDGLLILSTPNARYTLPIDGKPTNPYHVYEYTPQELVAELGLHFDCLKLFGQTLNSRFRMPPFWDGQQRLPKDLLTQARLLLWRGVYKLPVNARDALSRLLWGHPLFPGETDYDFTEHSVDTAPVVVAFCRPNEVRQTEARR